MDWFNVDRKGLAQLLERRGKEFAVYEIISNSWDTNATEVKVDFNRVEKEPKARLVVMDNDVKGFKELDHAFTLFAPSEKKDNAETRGRFNLGEKLVLAICEEAFISSTSGSLSFTSKGRRRSKEATEKGTIVDCLLKMTKAEFELAIQAVKLLIPPAGCPTFINGEKLLDPPHICSFDADLPTEIADADGNLKRARRKTVVTVYETRPGETAMLYEMGVPVVETGDRWHVEIQQKVPLNMDRDNVPPGFLREVRTLVVNYLHESLTEEDANKTWVREATSDKDCSPEATEAVMTLRFGEKRVAFDPSDPEANKLAVSEGYTVVHGSMLNKVEWANAKGAGAISPAGKVTPSPKPFVAGGDTLKTIPPAEWTKGMKRTAAYATYVAKKLLKKDLTFVVANDMGWGFNGAYGKGDTRLILNVARLGHSFFDNGPTTTVNRLLIHEFGHEFSSDHLSSDYYDALCKLGAELADLVHRDSKTYGLHAPDSFHTGEVHE